MRSSRKSKSAPRAPKSYCTPTFWVVRPAPAADVTGPWYSLDHHFVIEPGDASLPKPPITGKAEGPRPQLAILERRA